MLVVISPAKSLDFETAPVTDTYSLPGFIDQSATLIDRMRELSSPDIEQLMGISAKLADLNFGRYLNWSPEFTPENAKQAVLAFKGDVYQGLEAETFSQQEFDYAQDHLRILSGLYGVLRPLDLVQPYRLEMGIKLSNANGKNLYEFWGDQLTEALNQQLDSVNSDVLVNLASNEYFKSIKRKKLNATVVTPAFRDWKNGQYKMISFFAKKARGLMSAWIIRNQINDSADLVNFNMAGYRYDPDRSTPSDPVFLRDQPA